MENVRNSKVALGMKTLRNRLKFGIDKESMMEGDNSRWSIELKTQFLAFALYFERFTEDVDDLCGGNEYLAVRRASGK